MRRGLANPNPKADAGGKTKTRASGESPGKAGGLPLSLRILLWCLLNLLLLGVLFWGLFRGQLGLGLDTLLTGRAGDRLQGMADVLAGELYRNPESNWDEVLASSASAYGVRLSLVKLDGRWMAGEKMDLPPEVRARLLEPRFGGRPDELRPGDSRAAGPGSSPGAGPGPGPDSELRRPARGEGPRRGEGRGIPPGPPGVRPPPRGSFDEFLENYNRPENDPARPENALSAGSGADDRQASRPSSESGGFGGDPRYRYGRSGPPPEAGGEFSGRDSLRGFRPPGQRPPPPSARPRFLVRAGEPAMYWAGVPLPDLRADGTPPGPAVMLAAFESLTAEGGVIDPAPWLQAGFGALFLSLLLWFPLVRGITRSIRVMTEATESIAEGKFDTVAVVKRRDELGRLAQAINQLAGRLDHFVNGQRRFLGDIAHELNSPLARMQLGTSLLERGGDAAHQERVADVREEVEVMIKLVNELLSFSKAGLRARDLPLEAVPLAGLTRHVIARETTVAGESILTEIPETLTALADPELLARAVANLLRNALRYAGHAGPVKISAQREQGAVLLTVSDSGPGVPESELERIFEPFHRPDVARTREAGGSGLGLAIVRSCVQACQGSVIAANRRPSGLAVTIRLAAAEEGMGNHPPVEARE